MDVDLNKPLEFCLPSGNWAKVTGVVRYNDGKPLVLSGNYDVPYYIVTVGEETRIWHAKLSSLRNVPLELWVNVYTDGPAACVYTSEDAADSGAGPGRIRRARMVEVTD